MNYGDLTFELVRTPVEVAILVEGQQQSSPFVANHRQRGMILSDPTSRMHFSAAEALVLLGWLQEQEAELRAMVDEEVAAVELVRRGQAEVPGSG